MYLPGLVTISPRLIAPMLDYKIMRDVGWIDKNRHARRRPGINGFNFALKHGFNKASQLSPMSDSPDLQPYKRELRSTFKSICIVATCTLAMIVNVRSSHLRDIRAKWHGLLAFEQLCCFCIVTDHWQGA